MERRCDQFPDCADFSDEESLLLYFFIFLYMFPNTQYKPQIQKTIPQANCQLVVMGDNYLPDYIPFTVHPEKGLIKAPVQIKVCISRRNIGICFCCFCCVSNSTLGCNGKQCSSDSVDQDSKHRRGWANLQEPIPIVHDLVGNLLFLDLLSNPFVKVLIRSP